jgi:hypothetical protein
MRDLMATLKAWPARSPSLGLGAPGIGESISSLFSDEETYG